MEIDDCFRFSKIVYFSCNKKTSVGLKKFANNTKERLIFMKKSSFVAMILGTVSGVSFALGMCMVLLPQWKLFTEGVILGAVGLLLALITIIVWRKMEKKAPIKLNKKTLFTSVFAVLGALVLGAGMCLCLVWENFILGTVMGVAGIVMLLSLIPIIKGLK